MKCSKNPRIAACCVASQPGSLFNEFWPLLKWEPHLKIFIRQTLHPLTFYADVDCILRIYWLFARFGELQLYFCVLWNAFVQTNAAVK